jgi:hypothetical protein
MHLAPENYFTIPVFTYYVRMNIAGINLAIAAQKISEPR